MVYTGGMSQARAKAILRYGGGEALSYVDYGPEDGYPVLAQHGMIASIEDGRIFDRLAAAGARIVCAARPGYGDSSPFELRGIADWGALALLLADELGLERFDLLGTSSGAPYAYAVAAKAASRARNVFIFSGIPALCDAAVAALWPYPLDGAASLDDSRELARAIFFPGLPAGRDPRGEAETPASPAARDSLANGCFGPGLDLKIRASDWGFDLSEIAQRVYMEHARDDGDVPFAAAELSSRLLPNCSFRARPSGGHFSPELLDSFIERTMLPAMAASA